MARKTFPVEFPKRRFPPRDPPGKHVSRRCCTWHIECCQKSTKNGGPTHVWPRSNSRRWKPHHGTVRNRITGRVDLRRCRRRAAPDRRVPGERIRENGGGGRSVCPRAATQ